MQGSKENLQIVNRDVVFTFFVGDLVTHFDLKVLSDFALFWPKSFFFSFLFLVDIRNFEQNGSEFLKILKIFSKKVYKKMYDIGVILAR